MRVIVSTKAGKRGYSVYNPKGIKIATVERLNLVNAYRTKIKGKAALCGSYEGYSEDCDAYYKLSEVDNLALDTVVMTGYEIYVTPSGTLLEKSGG